MKSQWINRLTQAADLEGETMPGVPLLELAGDSRVLIEGHRGVVEYGLQKICVRVCYGILGVYGCNLKLACMNHGQLVITGQISRIEVIRRTGR